jgi:hypothetical protein
VLAAAAAAVVSTSLVVATAVAVVVLVRRRVLAVALDIVSARRLHRKPPQLATAARAAFLGSTSAEVAFERPVHGHSRAPHHG